MMRVDESKSYDYIEMSPRLKLILQLEKRLQDQFFVRRTLEKALVCGSSSCDMNQASMPKPSTELIEEIAVLELEVVYLEHYLLSLYRKAFEHQNLLVSPIADEVQRLKSPVTTPRKLFTDAVERHTPKACSASKLPHDALKDPMGLSTKEKMLDIGVACCHSSLSQRSAYTAQSSPANDLMSKDTPSCHSQPLPMAEVKPLIVVGYKLI